MRYCILIATLFLSIAASATTKEELVGEWITTEFQFEEYEGSRIMRRTTFYSLQSEKNYSAFKYVFRDDNTLDIFFISVENGVKSEEKNSGTYRLKNNNEIECFDGKDYDTFIIEQENYLLLPTITLRSQKDNEVFILFLEKR